MGTKDPWSVKQLVMATQQLHALRLHERFSDSDFFLIRTPKLDDPAIAVLMGMGGMAYGLNLFLGPTAAASYNAIFVANSEAQAHRSAQQSRMIGYQMTDPRELSHDARKWLKKAKIRPVYDRLYPDPMSLKPGKVPSVMLKDHETRLLLQVVRGIVTASKDKLFTPCGVDKCGRILVVQLDKETESPQATLAWETWTANTADTSPSPAMPASALGQGTQASARFDLSGLAYNNDTWLASLLPLPGSIQGDDRQPYVLVICSEQTQSMWPCLLMETDLTSLADALANVMKGQYDVPEDDPAYRIGGLTPPPVGKPEKLIFDRSTLGDALSTAFEPLGIECIDGEDNPSLQALFQNMHEAFNHNMHRDLFTQRLEDGQIPASNDLEGWKHVDGLLKDTIHEDFDTERRFLGSRALKRYFGSTADHNQLFSTYREQMIVDSYAHWFAISYRSSRNRPTLAESWLTRPEIPEAVKALLQSVIERGPSIYRIGDVDEDTGKIEFVDLFTGDITIVTDFALSTCLDPGLIVPAKLVPVGDFHFFFPAGPVMAGFQFNAVLRFFDFQNITPSPEEFRDHPYLLGWLWDVVHQQKARGVALRNTDGDMLMFHTAIFTYSDRPAVERYLTDRPDYEPDHEDINTWVWFREGVPGSTPVAPSASGNAVPSVGRDQADERATLLGRLKFEESRMVLTVNSRERFDAARTVLERAKGVVFQSLEVQSPADIAETNQNETNENDPIDRFVAPDTIPASTDEAEAMAEAARSYIANHYRQWLDHPLPALKGKTPRQAAKDPKLREKLAAMIRAIPEPTDLGDGNIQISVPREQMIVQLGLD